MHHNAHNPEPNDNGNPYDIPEDPALGEPDGTSTGPVAVRAHALLAARRQGEPWTVEQQKELARLEKLQRESPSQVNKVARRRCPRATTPGTLKGRHDNRPRCLGRIARSGAKSQDAGSRPECLDSMTVANWARNGAMASYYQG